MHPLALIIMFRFMIKLVATPIICYDSYPKVFYNRIISVISKIMFWNLHPDRNCKHVFLIIAMTMLHSQCIYLTFLY